VSEPKPRKPISGRSLSQQHAALIREGASFEFRMRWLLRVTEGWLPEPPEVGTPPDRSREAPHTRQTSRRLKPEGEA
jgi:hypothetical protein